MVISFQTVAEGFHYSKKEKSQLFNCIQTYSQKEVGSKAKCCALFWDKIFSCCHRSSWDLALRTMKKRVSKSPDCPIAYAEKISEFLLRYLISKEAAPEENAPLLANLMKRPVDDMDTLVSRVNEIHFIDLFHRVPYSEDALSYPDHRTLFGYFKEEFKRLEKATLSFSNAVNADPALRTARELNALLGSINGRSSTTAPNRARFRPNDNLLDQFDEGIAVARRILEAYRPILQEEAFQGQRIEIAYHHFKLLILSRHQIEGLHRAMKTLNKPFGF